MSEPKLRRFRLKKNCAARGVKWLSVGAIYSGKSLFLTRKVRIYSPDSSDMRAYLDMPYDWVVPVS